MSSRFADRSYALVSRLQDSSVQENTHLVLTVGRRSIAPPPTRRQSGMVRGDCKRGAGAKLPQRRTTDSPQGCHCVEWSEGEGSKSRRERTNTVGVSLDNAVDILRHCGEWIPIRQRARRAVGKLLVWLWLWLWRSPHQPHRAFALAASGSAIPAPGRLAPVRIFNVDVARLPALHELKPR